MFPPCAEQQPFVPRGLSLSSSPSTFCQSSGHRGVSVNALPPNVSAAVWWDTADLTPAICARPLGIKHIAGVNPFPTGKSVNGSRQSFYIKKCSRSTVRFVME